MKINLPIHMNREWIVVDANLLPDIAPHLASRWTFAVHFICARTWTVSNIETGLAVHTTGGWEGPDAAIDFARISLSGKTMTEFTRAVAKAPKECRE